MIECRSSAIKLADHCLRTTYQDCLHGRKLYTIHGGVKDRVDQMRRMCLEKEVVTLITVGIGGTGHNFQNFNAVIFMDRLWNPQVLPYCSMHDSVLILPSERITGYFKSNLNGAN